MSDNNNFWRKLERPIKVLAPMAGYTDSAFRLLCAEMGADVVVTELISADAIAYGKFKVEKTGARTIVSSTNHSTAEMLSFYEAERPLVIQLFGKFPEKFAKATKWITDELKPDGIDINMGCPARKVVGSDHGAALLKNPKLAVEIVKAVKESTDLPVSVKTRLGWDSDDQILEFAPKLIEAGVDALTIHGRTYKDGFKGSARWNNIYKIKEIIGDSAIIIGNGDMHSLESLVVSGQRSLISHQSLVSSSEGNGSNNNDKRLLETDDYRLNAKDHVLLDGFAIGRAAFGKPCIFDSSAVVSNAQFSVSKLKENILRHAELVSETKGEKGMMEFRKHLISYIKGLPDSKELRFQAVKVLSIKDVKKIIEQL